MYKILVALFTLNFAFGQSLKLDIYYFNSYQKPSYDIKIVSIPDLKTVFDRKLDSTSVSIPKLTPGSYTISVKTATGLEQFQTIKFRADTNVVFEFTETEDILDEIIITEKISSQFIGTNYEFESKDFAKQSAAFGDPSRIVQNLPGVLSMNDNSNRIVVRGNSPTNTAFYLEDIEIPNSSALGGAYGGGGGISIFNESSIEKFNFYVGAYPSRYNNSNAGVFNIVLKKGNTTQRKTIVKLSPLGVFAGTEGYFKKGKGASYILNARIWDILWLKKVGLNLDGLRNQQIPSFKDFTCKLSVPITQKSTLSLSSFGGMGSYILEKSAYSYDQDDYLPLVNILCLETHVNSKLSIKNRIAYSFAQTRQIQASYNTAKTSKLSHINDLLVHELKYYPSLVYKLSPRLKFGTGLIFTKSNSSTSMRYEYEGASNKTYNLIKNKYENLKLQHFQNWTYIISAKSELDLGFFISKYTYSPKLYVEPRINYAYKPNTHYTLSLGIGKTAKLMFENTPYTAKQVLPSNSICFSHTHSFDLGKKATVKLEVYYQALSKLYGSGNYINFYNYYDLEQNGSGGSFHSFYDNGYGRNFGFEYLISKKFVHGTYLQLAGSLFRSQCKIGNGLWMHTPFDSKYNVALSGNKEWNKTKDYGQKRMILSFRLVSFGGFYEFPINMDSTLKYKEITIFNFNYIVKTQNYFRADLGFQVNYEKRKCTHEFRIDLINATNRKNYLYRYYNEFSHQVETVYQLRFLPVISYGLVF